MEVLVSRIPVGGNITLAPTGNAYQSVTVDAELLAHFERETHRYCDSH